MCPAVEVDGRSLMLCKLPAKQEFKENREFVKELGFQSEQPWLKSAKNVEFVDLGISHFAEFAKVLGRRKGRTLTKVLLYQ